MKNRFSFLSKHECLLLHRNMDCTTIKLDYRKTGFFNTLVTDYLSGVEALESFYGFRPDPEGIRAAVAQRQQYPVDRVALVRYLQQQYSNVTVHEATEQSIRSLLKENTFVITTAHQPNLFTGPMYVIYKILHTIRVAETCNRQLPDAHFVPVYFMGSEDADMEELAHYHLKGTKHRWKTNQKGAFGRFIVDDALLQLMDSMAGELEIEPYGKELLQLLRTCYQKGRTLAQATFELIHSLFASYGLLVLIPDAPALKQQMVNVFREELLQQTSEPIVRTTAKLLEPRYKVQAAARSINLFYLNDGVRERIEKNEQGYHVVNTNLHFTEAEIIQELELHPERFSPNVILRGLFQEMILPGVAFIGGGGELSYWLELKNLFLHFNVPFPVLLLRNSFLLIEKKQKEQLLRLNLEPENLFLPINTLLEQYARLHAADKLDLKEEMHQIEQTYKVIQEQATKVDFTLLQHVTALQKQAVEALQQLEKKMLRSEKRKHDTYHRQLQHLKTDLFPGEGLQERIENFASFYAKWGPAFLTRLYEASGATEQRFTLLIEH